MKNVSRRQFFYGGILLTVGWISAQLHGNRPVAGLAQSSSLGPSPRRTLEQVFRHLLPNDDASHLCANQVDEFMAEGDSVAVEQLRIALLLLEFTAYLHVFHSRRFSNLSFEEQELVLERWATSRWNVRRQIYQGLRKAALFTYYNNMSIWVAIGYDGPWVRS